MNENCELLFIIFFIENYTFQFLLNKRKVNVAKRTQSLDRMTMEMKSHCCSSESIVTDLLFYFLSIYLNFPIGVNYNISAHTHQFTENWIKILIIIFVLLLFAFNFCLCAINIMNTRTIYYWLTKYTNCKIVTREKGRTGTNNYSTIPLYLPYLL